MRKINLIPEPKCWTGTPRVIYLMDDGVRGCHTISLSHNHRIFKGIVFLQEAAADKARTSNKKLFPAHGVSVNNSEQLVQLSGEISKRTATFELIPCIFGCCTLHSVAAYEDSETL